MIRVFLAIVLLSSVSWAGGREDSLDHFGASMGATVVGAAAYRTFANADPVATTIITTLGVIGVGLVKEYAVDQKANAQDIYADVSGALLGAGVHMAWKF